MIYGGQRQAGGSKRRLSRKKHCSVGNRMEEGSCLNKPLIKKVAKIMNTIGRRKHKSHQQKSKGTYAPIDLSMPCHEIHSQICDNLETVDDCQAEACLLFKGNILKKLTHSEREEFENSFKPLMDEDLLKGKVKMVKEKKHGRVIYKPRGVVDPHSWLSTDNIQGACEDDMVHTGYEFCGVEPIDFSDCRVSDLCKFNHRDKQTKGVTRLGIVFNTDPHDEDGEHWISLYMDLIGYNGPDPAIYYFDSYGRKAPPEIQEFIDKEREIASKHLGLKYFYNDEPFQKRGSQCGMYAIHFLREMAKGTSFEDYLNLNPSDHLMIQKRHEYFIDPNEV